MTFDLDFYDVIEAPMDAVVVISTTLGLDVTPAQERAAVEFINPELRNV